MEYRMSQFSKLFILPLFVVALSSFYAPIASAHVVVKPAEVITAGFQTFTAGVPNEKDISVVKLKLDMPEGLNYVSPTVKPGWTIETEKEGTGDDAVIKSITWSNGSIDAGLRDEFTFSAQVPAKDTELQWKAYQTYSDGTVVAWDQKEEKEGVENSGPYSVTKVVTKTEADTLTDTASNASKAAESKADTSLLLAIAALLVGAGGVYLAIRKK